MRLKPDRVQLGNQARADRVTGIGVDGVRALIAENGCEPRLRALGDKLVGGIVVPEAWKLDQPGLRRRGPVLLAPQSGSRARSLVLPASQSGLRSCPDRAPTAMQPGPDPRENLRCFPGAEPRFEAGQRW